MLAAAFFMFRNGESGKYGGKDHSHASTARLVLRFALPGVGVGVLTGLVGVGGGFLVVPALVLLGGIPMEAAIGTSLLIIAMNSFAGFAGYLGEAEIPWGPVSLFAALAVAGSFAGAYLVRFVPEGARRSGSPPSWSRWRSSSSTRTGAGCFEQRPVTRSQRRTLERKEPHAE